MTGLLLGWTAGLFVGGIALGAGARWLDSQLGAGVLQLSLATYQTLLSALISGLVTATVFALWMRTVVTGLMSGQVSVRVLAAFLDDRFQRHVLALMMGGVGVAIACLVSLPPEGPVPVLFSLPVLLAVTVGAIAGVLLTLNRGVRDLSVQDLVYRLTHRGLHLVRQREALMEPTRQQPDVQDAFAPERDVVRGVVLGWVVDIDMTRIARHLPEGSWTRLHVRAGQLLTPGAPLLTTSGVLSDEAHRGIRHAVLLGRQRQLEDDLGYLVRQMADMACAALAPSSNDTATADEGMKGLGLVLAELVRVGSPGRLMNIDARWILDEASLGVRDITKDTIERLRIAAAGTPSAMRQLVEVFGTVADAAREADRDDVLDDLREQLDRLLDSIARSELAASDRDDLRSQAAQVGLLSTAEAVDASRVQPPDGANPGPEGATELVRSRTTSGRTHMAAEQVHQFLDEHGIAYEVHEHERVVDANHLAQSEDVSGWDVAKPVLLTIGDQLAMAVVPAAVHVDLDKASDVLGHAQVRLATEDEFTDQFPDCEPGAEPPFGNLYGVPVFLDESLRARDRMVCRDGSHTQAITLAVADYVRSVAPEIVDLSTPAS